MAQQVKAPFELVYDSEQMKEVARTAQQIASSEIPVLVIGETGVGKEMLARYIHHLSGRAGQFIALNCAAVPASLMESEMFGYVRGAFSGADADKKGLLVMAHEGTLFLDEIGNMPPDMQAKLLRALEEYRIRPLGSTRETQVNFRLLSATNRDLKEDVDRGRFREDLYYRINVVTVKLPPLRERREDIPVLIKHFLQKSGGRASMDKDTLDMLFRYDWPGNVRELKNEIARLISVSGGAIGRNMLKDEVTRPAASAPTGGALQDMECRMIEDVLKSTGGNKQKASKLLGISRTTLYRKMKRHGITCAEP
jgi:transcriptional regulator with PAS, ATPase and Fis domain